MKQFTIDDLKEQETSVPDHLRNIALEIVRELDINTHEACDESCTEKGVTVEFITEALRQVELETLERAAKVADIEHSVWAQHSCQNEPKHIRNKNILRESGAFEASRNISNNIRAMAKNGDTET